MATLEYCSNLAAELESWSQKLHDLSGRIDKIPSIDKYKLTPQIEGLHILVTELDDRINELRTECPREAGHKAAGREIQAGHKMS